MRAAYHLAFLVFSAGTVATPTTAPNATDQANSPPVASQQSAVLEAARSLAVDLSPRQEAVATTRLTHSAAIGEALPETIALHPIPKHETYRYAVVNGHRVIVDAASRKIVYIIR
ncbi:DUF1236 domain-containing protein [Microvirga arsenatis]|uniref:DUF1236 domain-containing protein n=1 Tax=Microvirga arsenatis TaxID=2692265 RepID=A0ABW9YZ73_9HYPH|nr:DUF1236 domain-containing protein [Microvirga arsenatis]NBJ11090.1 DUF1236 domain-containing protein [Microvirga arsenatis]NBJ25363.1 DUF1236 domain-containing protein [Microvirga arsenatis]